MTPASEPAVTVCEAACDYPSIWQAQYDGHRHLVLSGVLGPDVVTLPDTLIEGDGAILRSDLYNYALFVPVEAARLTVRDLTFSRTSPDDGMPLVGVAAEGVRFEGMIVRNVASAAPRNGDLLELDPGTRVTLVDPQIEDNVGVSPAPLFVGRGASLTVEGGRIVGNRGGVAGVVYVDRGTLTVEGTMLAAGGAGAIQGIGGELTLTDVQGTGHLSVQGGSLTLRGGTWGGPDDYVSASNLDRLEIDGADVTATALWIVGARGETQIHGATLRGLRYGGVSLWEVPSLEVSDTWICGEQAALPPVALANSCNDGCSFDRVVVTSGVAPALDVSGDVVLSHATVIGSPAGPVVASTGSLTLDHVLTLDHAGPAVTARDLEVEDSAFATLDGLDGIDPGDAVAVNPVFRGQPVGPCGLDLQLADVPRNDWLIAHGVGAFPVCWTDADGDGSGVELVDLEAPADACPAGTAPAPGDCDDDDPTLDRICDPPQPPPDGGTANRSSSRAGGGRCDAAPGRGGALGPLGAFVSLLLRRRRPVR